jgi:hypothetical protein
MSIVHFGMKHGDHFACGMYQPKAPAKKVSDDHRDVTCKRCQKVIQAASDKGQMIPGMG